MLAVAAETPAAEARMMVFPVATPVTGTITELAFAGIVTDAGTEAMFESSELRVTVRATGVTADKLRVAF
jgi:hypothetical protein